MSILFNKIKEAYPELKFKDTDIPNYTSCDKNEWFVIYFDKNQDLKKYFMIVNSYPNIGYMTYKGICISIEDLINKK